MGLLVRSVQYIHTPTLEVETSDGVKYTLETGNDGALVIKSDKLMFAELGKPYEVVVRQLEQVEEWTELKAVHP